MTTLMQTEVPMDQTVSGPPAQPPATSQNWPPGQLLLQAAPSLSR